MSSWASRAKDHFSHKDSDATTKTTETTILGVLGVPTGHPCKKQQSDFDAGNDPAPPPDRALVEVALNFMGRSNAGLVDVQGHADHVEGLLHLVDEPDTDADRWCWPNSTAMTGSEIDLFTARLAKFVSKGLGQIDAESLADTLVTRDREGEDRALCLECTHLTGWRTSWRCGNWQAAGIARQVRDAQLPADLVFKLQRCAGMTNAFKLHEVRP